MPSPSSQALVRQRSDMELMPPPPPAKRIKRPPKVLDEDDYTDALSHIIARDFFPGLVETQAQQEYLDALDSKDKQWIASAGRKLSDVMTPGARRRHPGLTTPVLNRGTGRDGSQTPATPRRAGDTPANWAGDTPRSNISTPGSTGSTSTSAFATASRDEELINMKKMGLGAFQEKYTSEDNESFYKILDKQNKKRREKHAWMWSGNKIPTARQILYKKEERKRLESQAALPEEKEGQQLVLLDVKSKDADTRPSRVDGWKSRPENSLMFVPGSVEDELATVQQRKEEESRAGPKQVIYHNTRVMPSNPKGDDGDGGDAVPPSPSISAIRDAIAGRPRPSDSEPGFTGGETPRVNGYAFVDEDEPEPTPSNQDDVDDEEYHLRQILHSQGGVDSTPNPFRLRENRRREMLHHRMVEKASKSKRAEKIASQTKTPVPLFPSSPMLAFGKTPGGRGAIGGGGNSTPGASKAALTPAAQRLWASVGNSTPRKMGSGSTGLNNMWTPTPRRAK